MPAMSSNTSNTLVLLLLLGVLIYFLQSPCDPENKQEDFADVKANNKPMKQVQTAMTAPEEDVRAKVMSTMLANTEKPAPQVISSGEKCNQPDEYDAFDKAGANLEFAFEDNNLNPASSNAVDLNKQNQKDYCAKDFLPKENNPEWWDDGFSQAKYNLNDDKLINTERYIIGINTVGQSLKNASYDIRGTIANPKFSVSPWNNSTVEADYNLKSLC
jgi:hypothetical protein